MNSFADRLKNERNRLNLSQEEFGLLCGVKKLAQFNYEKGERKPDSDYFEKAIKIGVDINYLFTGVYSAISLSAEEQMFLDKLRLSDDVSKYKALLLLSGVQNQNNLAQGIINSPNSNISNSFNK